MFPASLSPEESTTYREYLDRVEREESYSGFLSAEKSLIHSIDDRYIYRRYEFIREAATTRPASGNPTYTIDAFVQFCVKNGYLNPGEEADRFLKAVRVLTLELFPDYPCFYLATEGVKHVPNLVFADYGNKKLLLDLFLPENVSNVPCIICIHGGGWAMHRRIWFAPYAAYFASKGYAAVTVDYRLLPAVKVPQCVNDVKAAARWVHAEGPKHGIDTGRIGAIGGSAGAHLSAMLAMSSHVSELEGDGGNSGASSRIHAGVGFATPAFNPQRILFTEEVQSRIGITEKTLHLMSPYMHITADAAPFYLLQGTGDTVVDPQNSIDIHDKYQSVGAQAKLKMIDGAPHVFYTNRETAEETFRFFETIF